MKICVVFFNYYKGNAYTRLFSVFQKSLVRNMPDVKLETVWLPNTPPVAGKQDTFVTNTIKLKEWVRVIEETEEEVIFADADMLCLHSAQGAFASEFDVAYTVRPIDIPINGGIVFAKPTDAARLFFRKWLETNIKMYENPAFHGRYHDKYAGMNQSAFGYLLENPVEGVKMRPVPCSIWNAVEEDWASVGPETVFCHIKGTLRKIVLNRKGKGGVYFPVANWWKAFEGDTFNDFSNIDDEETIRVLTEYRANAPKIEEHRIQMMQAQPVKSYRSIRNLNK